MNPTQNTGFTFRLSPANFNITSTPQNPQMPQPGMETATSGMQTGQWDLSAQAQINHGQVHVQPQKRKDQPYDFSERSQRRRKHASSRRQRNNQFSQGRNMALKDEVIASNHDAGNKVQGVRKTELGNIIAVPNDDEEMNPEVAETAEGIRRLDIEERVKENGGMDTDEQSDDDDDDDSNDNDDDKYGSLAKPIPAADTIDETNGMAYGNSLNRNMNETMTLPKSFLENTSPNSPKQDAQTMTTFKRRSKKVQTPPMPKMITKATQTDESYVRTLKMSESFSTQTPTQPEEEETMSFSGEILEYPSDDDVMAEPFTTQSLQPVKYEEYREDGNNHIAVSFDVHPSQLNVFRSMPSHRHQAPAPAVNHTPSAAVKTDHLASPITSAVQPSSVNTMPGNANNHTAVNGALHPSQLNVFRSMPSHRHQAPAPVVNHTPSAAVKTNHQASPFTSAVQPSPVNTIPNYSVMFVSRTWNEDFGRGCLFNRHLATSVSNRGIMTYNPVTERSKKPYIRDSETGVIQIHPDEKKLAMLTKKTPSVDWFFQHKSLFPYLGDLAPVIKVVIGYLSVGYDSGLVDAAKDLKQSVYPEAKLIFFNLTIPEDYGDTRGEQESLDNAASANVIFSVGHSAYSHFENKYKALFDVDVKHLLYLPPVMPMFIETNVIRPGDAKQQVLSVCPVRSEEDFSHYTLSAMAMGKVAKTCYQALEQPPVWNVIGVNKEMLSKFEKFLKEKASCANLRINVYPCKSLKEFKRNLMQSSLYITTERLDTFNYPAYLSMQIGIPTLIPSCSGLVTFLDNLFKYKDHTGYFSVETGMHDYSLSDDCNKWKDAIISKIMHKSRREITFAKAEALKFDLKNCDELVSSHEKFIHEVLTN
ncbi:uncharacterized protein LOC144450791 [Glandiceps talaboti]